MSVNKSLVILLALLVLGLPLATAQSQSNDIGPGMVAADSPFYGLELAWDNAAVTLGLKNAGDVTQERAAEAKDAVERNRTDAALRAVENAQKMANRSKAGDEEGVQRAMTSLQDTMSKMEERIQNAPNEEAREGMQGALENMRGAVNNMEEDRKTREEARNQRDNANLTRDRGPTENQQDRDRNEDRQQNVNGDDLDSNTTPGADQDNRDQAGPVSERTR